MITVTVPCANPVAIVFSNRDITTSGLADVVISMS